MAPVLLTQRLELVPATPESVRAALSGASALGSALGAAVPATWPPDYVDAAAFEFTLERLGQGPEQDGWWLHFVVRAAGAGGRRLIGTSGYAGPPSADGTVEIGYGIVSDERRQGYASEAARALVVGAFARPTVQRVIAETLPELAPSIGVLRKLGFSLIGDGSQPGVIRFELTRADYAG